MRDGDILLMALVLILKGYELIILIVLELMGW